MKKYGELVQEIIKDVGGKDNILDVTHKGDAFAERNQYAMAVDYEEQPPFFKLSDTHYAATWLLHPNAPKVEMPETLKNRIARMKQKREEV